MVKSPSLIGLALGAAVDRRFFILPGLVAGFLLQHAVQGWCPPVTFFRRGGFRTAAEIEVTPAGKVVWALTAADVPGVNLTWACSLQVLRNGNVVVGNFLRGQEGKGAHAFEVTRHKKVVWTFADHCLVKSLTTIRVLDDR
jgi:hypothetical protein